MGARQLWRVNVASFAGKCNAYAGPQKAHEAVLLDETPIHLLQAFLQLRLSPPRKQMLQ